MGLSKDQRAMLRLLAQREEGYEDIAALMGIGVEEVRARVREAVAALDDDQPSPAAGPVATAEESARPAGPVAAGDPPPTAPSAGEAAAPVSRQPKPARQLPVPKDRRRLVELLGGLAIVVLVVLFATGAVDIGGSDSDSDSGSTSASSGNGTIASKSTKLTQAVLEPVDGGEAKGLAVFGRSKGSVLLALQAEGLEPSDEDRSYAVSLSRSPTERIPIAVTRVGGSGKIEAQYPVPTEALGLLANGFDQMELSLVSNSDLKSALTEAGKEQKAPDYDSEDVLRGAVTGPIVNIAAREGG